VLRQTLARATTSHACLVGMGIVFPSRQEQDILHSIEDQQNLAGIIVDFALHLVGERGVDLALDAFQPPSCFAALASTDPGRQQIALDRAKFAWSAVLSAERLALRHRPWSTLVSEIVWCEWPAIRATYMLLEADHWRVGRRSGDWIHDMFNQIGDSRCVEQVHKHIRAYHDKDDNHQIVKLIRSSHHLPNRPHRRRDSNPA
jgi:hypothetical protein